MSRRDAMRILGVGAASVVLSALGSPLVAYGSDSGSEGGGGGGSEGTGDDHDPTGGPENSYVGKAWQWYDDGGFVRDGRDPDQGWNSGTWFWNNKVQPFMNQITGATPSINMNATVAGTGGKTVRQMYNDAVTEACNNAIERANAHRLPGSEPVTRARVVGVGWTFYVSGDKNAWMLNSDFYLEDRRPFSTLIRKAAAWSSGTPQTAATVEYLGGYHDVAYGNSIIEGLPDDVGWSARVSYPGTPYDGLTWRNYAYNSADDDNTGRNYVIVVVAVADGEPKPHGYVRLSKGVAI